jgi:predicted ATPase
MNICECQAPHEKKRIVLTGGPGAGKTAVLELVRQYFCRHIAVLPESAGIVFGGGFPRGTTDEVRRASQRAIFYVQRELEAAFADQDDAITLCDRGTVDGVAYWPGPDDFWASLGTTRTEQLERYAAVIHLRTPPPAGGYNHQNPLRIETAAEASVIDAKVARAWDGHPRRFFVEPELDFLTKATQALALLRAELPACCRAHVVPELDARERR